MLHLLLCGFPIQKLSIYQTHCLTSIENHFRCAQFNEWEHYYNMITCLFLYECVSFSFSFLLCVFTTSPAPFSNCFADEWESDEKIIFFLWKKCIANINFIEWRAQFTMDIWSWTRVQVNFADHSQHPTRPIPQYLSLIIEGCVLFFFKWENAKKHRFYSLFCSLEKLLNRIPKILFMRLKWLCHFCLRIFFFVCFVRI